MKGLERKRVKIKQAFPDRDLLVCIENNQDFLAKLSFQHVYPEDEIILFGQFRYTKSMGRFFDVSFYRELLNEYWLIKWLKLEKQLNDEDIVRMMTDKKGLKAIQKDIKDMKEMHHVFNYLLQQQVSEQVVAKIEHDFRWNRAFLLEDPYHLLKYPPIQYQLVENITKKFSCKTPQESKAKFLTQHFLERANQSGHYYLPTDELQKKLKKHQVEFQDVPLTDLFYVSEEKVYLTKHYEVEQAIAKDIALRTQAKTRDVEEDVIDRWEASTGFSLAKNQKEAVLMALGASFCVVTGGPGVGKTTVCKCITDLLGENHSILMVAPTGRAAKRANESTGLPTSTVHSLLGYNGIRFAKGKQNQIETDVLVIDESSMVDAPLLCALLEATPKKTKIIFVGDVDQLPSVGPGQILRDLIESSVVPVTRLTEIFRQAADSPIITLAYAVNNSELPALTNHEDLIYIEEKNENVIFQQTVDIAEALYKEHDAFDVQLLIPMYKGEVGIDAINKELQHRLNPHAKSVKIGSYEIREKDKVIQTKNVQSKGIYNGDVGIVTFVSPQKIKVRFQGQTKETLYERDDFWDLQLSYAITVHRSQGSEYKYVVIPTVESYGVMLQKNLLYTAITRSKKKLWMLYQTSALKKAIHPNSVPKRYTSLRDFLKESA